MKQQELEKKLACALDRAAPDDVTAVLSRCREQKGTVIQMTEHKHGLPRAAKNLIAACLAVALVGGSGFWYQQAAAVASVVSLDVNPSIELTVNKGQKVLSCTALNRDAQAVLEDMDGGADLKGTQLPVAVNAVVGALVRNGYLEDVSSALLISVEDRDQQRAAQLRQELMDSVDETFQSEEIPASVLSQTLTQNKDLGKLAKDNHISTGKAALVENVLMMNDSLSFAKLSNLSVEELRDLAELGAPAMPIGKDAALLAALRYAGVTQDYELSAEVDPELDEEPACYEVELYHNTLGELEYKVDAWTGAVLSGSENVMKDQPAAPGRISQQKAERIALDHAGLKRESVTALFTQWDIEDGRSVWDVEFYADGMEYEYTIDAADGAILESEREKDEKGVIGGADGMTGIITRDTVTEDRARTIAMKHAGVKPSQVSGLKSEQDEDDGRQIWEVEFTANGLDYEYEIDLLDGSVWKYESERSDSAPAASEAIPESKARDAALAHAGLTASQVTELEIDFELESGRPEYEVEFKSGNMEYEYVVDGLTGGILSHSRETDD